MMTSVITTTDAAAEGQAEGELERLRRRLAVLEMGMETIIGTCSHLLTMADQGGNCTSKVMDLLDAMITLQCRTAGLGEPRPALTIVRPDAPEPPPAPTAGDRCDG
jgi:hypothetical protein